MSDDSIIMDANGFAILFVSTRYDISHTSTYWWCGGQVCSRTWYYGTYTVGVYVNWGDGTVNYYHKPEDGYFGSVLRCTHQYPEGVFTITGYETYRNISGQYNRDRHFTLSNIDGRWVKWYTDCGDIPWTGNGDFCSWNGNYGIMWDSNFFELSIKDMYNTVKMFSWAFSAFGLGIEALFKLWFGDNWLDTQLANKFFPWMSNWSYWNGNAVSVWPWNWWWTNWAPGFNGPGRIGLDVEGVWHTKDDPLTAIDICNRNAGASEIHGGFRAYPRNVDVGERVFFFDESLGMEKLLYSFGDGENSSKREPVHVYKAPGVYSVIQMCYPKASLQQLPILFPRYQYITVKTPPVTSKKCSFTPVPDGWSLNAAMHASKVWIQPGETITFYMSSNSTCGCESANLWPGEYHNFDDDARIYTDRPGFPFNWTVQVTYNAPGVWYPFAIFRNAATGEIVYFQWKAGIYVLNPDGTYPVPPEEIPNPIPEQPEYPLVPPPAHMHRYLRLGGSDWNDGKSWEKAYKTWEKAISGTPVDGWLHVDYDDYRHQAPVQFDKNIVIVPEEDYREVGQYKEITMPSYGKSKWWWPW
jgi:hypothetical protein